MHFLVQDLSARWASNSLKLAFIAIYVLIYVLCAPVAPKFKAQPIKSILGMLKMWKYVTDSMRAYVMKCDAGFR